MTHYRFIDPAVKARARERGIDIEKSTDDFLRSVRKGTGMRRDLLSRFEALLLGPRMAMDEAEEERRAA